MAVNVYVHCVHAVIVSWRPSAFFVAATIPEPLTLSWFATPTFERL